MVDNRIRQWGNMQQGIAWASATELLAAYRSKAVSPVEATQETLRRAEALDPALNAFCLLDPEAALEQARQSEGRWQRGAPLGLLDGVPVSIKDIILTKGWPTLRGSKAINPDQPWDEDGPAVARLREQGAVIFGKTTTSEFAAKPTTNTALCGVTRNPWNLERTPGGSSGGAAASVAAGISALALGTDAGGSIRMPANFCGIFGFKPGGGRVAMYPPTPYATLAGFGPMTRSVVDAALMLSVIAQPDPRDWDSLPADPTQYHAELAADPKQWRIAWSPTLCGAVVDPEVAALTESAAKVFEQLGAQVETVETVFPDSRDLLFKLMRGLTDYAFHKFTPAQLAVIDPDLLQRVEQARGATAIDHLDAEMQRAQFARRMNEFHQRYDLLLSPVTAVPAFAAERNEPEGYSGRNWYPFTFPFNLTRQPAASVPCGFTRDGLPVGLQIVGPRHRDLLVLQAARAFEQAAPWAAQRPPLATRSM
ncbi:amidase [Ferrovibrio sp.]|uniref:amidase n=1 Tax=Ferrovibrio sp. TaxID=1917215 RepID=UPI0025BD8C89|nr:amidase [Ferrovibrio sp.]